FGAKDNTDPIWLGETPKYDAMLEKYPPSSLRASGEAVGLGAGKPGNSEAGHINIGSGRCVAQDDVRLDNAMKDGSFEKNEVFLKAIEDVKARGKALHLLALLTKQSSHGSIDYPLALLKMAKELPEVYVHIIFDGRSTEPGSAPALLADLDQKMEEIGQGQVVDGVGRGIALDRDQNWAKIEKVYKALVEGKAEMLYR
ncbi:MAG: phosphoglycerate mutase (2,3-diphosphoglycerate-independent), partial [Eubacteriales bacterium]|nr:phosphoglycerate mutase (2,3-diphosphoglycerate-independent) [Eubacteriales bacterium]